MVTNPRSGSSNRIIFVSKISKMGNDLKYIRIPSDFWNEIKELEKRKQVKVTVEEAYE